MDTHIPVLFFSACTKWHPTLQAEESFDEPSEPEDEVDGAESTDPLKSSEKHDFRQSRSD